MNKTQSSENLAVSHKFTSSSQLQFPLAFLRLAVQDLITSIPYAKRLFMESLAEKYRHSSLGVIWTLIPTLAIVFYFIFLTNDSTVLANKSLENSGAFFAYGMIVFQIFLETFQNSRVLLSQKMSFFTRQRLKVEAFLLAMICEMLLTAWIKIPILIGIALVTGYTFQMTWFLIIILLPVIVFLAAGTGLLLSTWNVLSKDIEGITSFIPFILLGITPVFVHYTPDTIMYYVHQINPLSHVLNTIRGVMTRTFLASDFKLIFSCIFSIVLPLCAWLFIRVSLPHIVERHLN